MLKSRFALLNAAALAVMSAASTVSANEYSRERGSPGLNSVAEVGPLRFWADGDVIFNYSGRSAYTNQTDRAFSATSLWEEEPLLLLRPTVVLGRIGEGFWAGARAEIGNKNRSFFDHEIGQARAGVSGFLGYGGLSVTVANGATQAVNINPIDWYSNPFANSILDGTFTSRKEKSVSANHLDSKLIWQRLVGQNLDDVANGAIAHETVALRYASQVGTFGVMTDFNAKAFMAEYQLETDRFQTEISIAHASGFEDRWGNDVDDWWLAWRGGYHVTPTITADAIAMAVVGKDGANSGFAPGSYNFGLGAGWEFMTNHHARIGYQHSKRGIVNRNRVLLRTETQHRLDLSYGWQADRNIYVNPALAIWKTSDERGSSSIVTNYRFATGVKF